MPEIGDIDEMGLPIGYIDESGRAWQSRLERDAAIGSSALDDASTYDKFDVIQVLDDAEVLPQNRVAAFEEYFITQAIRETDANTEQRNEEARIIDMFSYKKRDK